MGSDDNTHAAAFRWMADVMSGARGLETDRGTNFDGSKRYMSFYVNTSGWGNPAVSANALVQAAQHAYGLGHSISNHTHRHSRFVGGGNWNAPLTGDHPNNHTIRMGLEAVYVAIDSARIRMIEAGIPQAHQFGFRTPFLTYSDTAFTAMRMAGILYDCSIEAIIGRPGNTHFPYTLDNISGTPNAVDANGNVAPDNRGHWGRRQTFDGQVVQNVVREHPGLWVLPASLVAIHPDDLEAITAKRASWMSGDLITGFDYNLWNQAMMTEDETVNALMHTLRLHLNGNRAPFTFGPHSQFFFTLPPPGNFPNLTFAQRQRAFERFVAYASEIPDVFFVSGDMVIHWMKAPVCAKCFNPEDYFRGPRENYTPCPPNCQGPASIDPSRTSNRNTVSGLRIGALRAGNLSLNVANAGIYTVFVHSVDGKMLAKTHANLNAGANSVNIGQNLARGVAIVRVANANTVSQRRISIR